MAALSARPRILMLTTQLGYGGAETSFIRLANFLSQTMDVTVALFTSDYGMEAYAKGHETLNATVVLLDAPEGGGRFRRWRQRIARVRVLKQNVEATISFLSGPNLVNVLAGRNRSSIVSLRGSRRYDPVASRWQNWLFRTLLDPLIYRLAARIVPVSPGLGHELGRSAQSKVRPIPPFIDRAMLQHKRSEPVPAEYAVLQGQPVIIAVGRLSIEKGFEHLIRVFAAVAQRAPGSKLLLVGDGPQLASLRAQCAASGLAMDDVAAGVSAVLFAGYRQNVMPLLQLARVYALTSATEGFPSVLLEAMVAGVPVIAADTPWGARSILGAEPSTKPYPTVRPTPAAYGMLMPRIDQPEHEAAWVETLLTLREAPAAAASRPADFDIAPIGAQWQQLIAEVTHA